MAMGSLGTAESKLLAVRLINDARHFAVAEVGDLVQQNCAAVVHGSLQMEEDQHEIIDIY